ncbi:hypothetical protein ACFPRL_32875 [Pseudoclavibacter helvolus]
MPFPPRHTTTLAPERSSTAGSGSWMPPPSGIARTSSTHSWPQRPPTLASPTTTTRAGTSTTATGTCPCQTSCSP